jgi:protein-tyrosine phosphatase
MGGYSVLLVCTGNICRSPTAEAVLRVLATESGLPVQVDSAGTHDYHVGEPPDRRAAAHARARGYDLSALRARQVGAADFERFDLLLAMDRGHLEFLRRMSPPEHHHKLRLFLEFAGLRDADVPDPYYGGAEGFEQVLDMVEAASHGLVAHVRTYLLRVST